MDGGLTKWQLTPFVARFVERERGNFRRTETGSPMDGKAYLREWKKAGGRE